MELSPQRLHETLAREPLRPIYLVAGSEPLRVQEAADAVRARARDQGYDERVVYEVDADFEWDTLGADFAAPSLFGARRLFDLRLPGGRPGAAGSEFLRGYCAAPPPDTVLLLICEEWSKKHVGKWSEAIAAAGHAVICWPLSARELPQWLRARLSRVGLHADDEALAMLAAHTEGNLLAAAQEIEKLGLLLPQGGRLDAAGLQAAIADSARYDVFKLFEAALAGEGARVLRILAGLRAEGAQVPALLGWIGGQLSLLARVAGEAGGGDPAVTLRRQGVWASRQALYRAALAHHPGQFWERCLAECARVDQAAKGRLDADPWRLLERLLLAVATPAAAAALLGFVDDSRAGRDGLVGPECKEE